MASSPERSLVLESVRTVLLGARSGAAPGGPAPVPLPVSERSWVAFSGGVDSTVLLDAAARVLGGRSAEGLAAVHVNHGLYPDAGAWEDHCREAAARLGIRLEVRRAVVRASPGGGNLEAAARAARYGAIAEVVPRGEPVLLAHHLDDQAETALMRILRGAGPAGMAGMRREVTLRGLRLVRPLLAVPRSEILAYARERRLSWVEDPGNAAAAHDRNHMRRRVLPVVAERWPGAAATLVRLARRSEETAAMLDALGAADLADAKGEGPGTLNAAAIAALPPPRAANALRTWLLARHRIPPPPRRWLRVLAEEVAAAGSDRRPEAVRAGIWVRRYRGELHTGREGVPPRLPESTGWRIDGEPLELPHGRLAAVRTVGEGIAAARLPPFVEVRFRRGGERCRPRARGVTKPLKHLMQELGVPPWERGAWPLVFAGGCIAAAPGLFVCEPFAARGGEPAWRLEWTPRQPGDTRFRTT